MGFHSEARSMSHLIWHTNYTSAVAIDPVDAEWRCASGSCPLRPTQGSQTSRGVDSGKVRSYVVDVIVACCFFFDFALALLFPSTASIYLPINPTCMSPSISILDLTTCTSYGDDSHGVGGGTTAEPGHRHQRVGADRRRHFLCCECCRK